MCLAIPAKLVEIQGNRGKIETGGVKVDIGLDLLENAKIGDYLIVHAGYGLEIINDEEAEKRLSLFRELEKEGHIRA